MNTDLNNTILSDKDLNAIYNTDSTAGNFSGGRAAAFVQKKGMIVMRSVLQDLKEGKFFDVAAVTQFVADLITSCKGGEDQFITLARLKDPDNYACSHAINVCVYSIALGSKLQYKDDQLLCLGMASLLHDIGEVRLPERMIGKTAKYTKAELAAMQKHPQFGYEILQKKFINIRRCAFRCVAPP